MSNRLEQAIEAARSLDADRQDDVVRAVLALIGRPTDPVVLSDEERIAIELSRQAAARGEFAPSGAVDRVLTKYR